MGGELWSMLGETQPSVGPIGVYACSNESFDPQLHYRDAYEAVNNFKYLNANS